MDQREKGKRNVKIGGRIASGGHCHLQRTVPHEQYETFEEILTAIGPAITITADRKTIMNYHTRGQARKTIIDYHDEFEQAQKGMIADDSR